MKKSTFYILLFIPLFIIVYILLQLPSIIANKLLLSFIYSLIIIFIILIFPLIRHKKLPKIHGKTALRYTMFCNSCGWEWMSKTTEKNHPNYCPNCHEKSKLEVIGWRRVKIIPKTDKDLRSFLRRRR